MLVHRSMTKIRVQKTNPTGAAGTEETWGDLNIIVNSQVRLLLEIESHLCGPLGYHWNQRIKGQFWLSVEENFLTGLVKGLKEQQNLRH